MCLVVIFLIVWVKSKMVCWLMVYCVNRVLIWSFDVMVMIIRIFDGDVLDVFCYCVYGMLVGMVEVVFDVNLGFFVWC